MAIWAAPEVAAAADAVTVRPVLTINLDSNRARELAEALASALDAVTQVAVRAGPTATDACLAEANAAQSVLSADEASAAIFLVLRRVGEVVDVEPTGFGGGRFVTLSSFQVPLSDTQGRSEALARAAEGLRARLELARPEPPPPVEPPEPKLPAPEPPAAPVVVATTEPPPTPGIHPAVWVAGGVAVALAAGGTVSGLMASADESALVDDGCETRVCDPARIDGMNAKALAADVMFGGAIVSAGLAVILHFALPEDVSVAPSGGGLEVSF